MKNRKIIFSILCLFFGFTQIQAQQTLAIAGGNATGSGGSASYTLGQVVYTTKSGNSTTVTEGVQQPYEISVLATESVERIEIQLSAYPNPTNDLLQLKIENYKTADVIYQLYSLNGVLLDSQKGMGNETTIQMRNYPTAVYLLKVTENNKSLKTFQIIKK
jgi:hypothetical protein